MGIYINGDLYKKLELIENWIEGEGEERKVIIGGDFNARTREEEGFAREVNGG